MVDRSPIWSIGHSNHELAHLLKLLEECEIDVVADVRSQPYSRYSPHFNREPLRRGLAESDIEYAFLGNELGGRPYEPGLYDGDGHVLYGELARTERFRSGLNRLLFGSEGYAVAMLCSEEDPATCHRRLLVARVLTEIGVSVIHIRGDGTTISEAELAARLEPSQPALFGEESTWRSTRSVSPNTALRTSSRL